MSGVELLERLKAGSPECEVVLLTGEATIESAVDAMKRGAHDYLTKPFPLAELEVVVQRAFAQRQLRKENRQLRLTEAQLTDPERIDKIAKQLGLNEPQPGQVVHPDGIELNANTPVWAQAKAPALVAQ